MNQEIADILKLTQISPELILEKLAESTGISCSDFQQMNLCEFKELITKFMQALFIELKAEAAQSIDDSTAQILEFKKNIPK